MCHYSRIGLLLLAGATLLIPACAGDGQFTLLGYTTHPNYDTNIRTIYLPIPENRTYFRGLEFELHQALQNAIHTRTPYRVTSNRDAADTELVLQIKGFNRAQVLISPNFGTRAEETTMLVALTWTDTRTGETLSRRQRRPGEPVPLDLPPPGGPTMLPGVTLPTAPTQPSPLTQDAIAVPIVGGPAIEARPGQAPVKGEPIQITSSATYHPELGESMTFARQRNCEKMAIHIVNMMQLPW